MLCGIWASIPTKYYENKTVCVFFQGASDGNAKIRRNISQKSKNNEKLNFKKSDFQELGHFSKAQQASPKALKTTRRYVAKENISPKEKTSERVRG